MARVVIVQATSRSGHEVPGPELSDSENGRDRKIPHCTDSRYLYCEIVCPSTMGFITIDLYRYSLHIIQLTTQLWFDSG